MILQRDRPNQSPSAAYGRFGFSSATCLSVFSNASGDSSAPSCRAISLNLADCSAGVIFGGFTFGMVGCYAVSELEEIVISYEMVSAGLAVLDDLKDSLPNFGLAEAVYTAMEIARRRDSRSMGQIVPSSDSSACSENS